MQARDLVGDGPPGWRELVCVQVGPGVCVRHRQAWACSCLAKHAQLCLLPVYGGRCHDDPRGSSWRKEDEGLGEPRGTNSNSEGKAG